MNNYIGVFTFNPNRRHNCGDRNKEDLVPNTQSFTNNKSQEEDNENENENETQELNEEMISLLRRRFVYAGALIACCIVSALPQPMKLSSIVWDYLTREEVSINSIYEIDDNFKELMKTAESLQAAILSNSTTEEQFERVFLHVFEINDSFDNLIELIPSGSKTKVTKENLHEFIELAKNKRIHEFDSELKDMKEGFDKIMTDKNLTKILRPNELKLFVCGEPNCDVEQMQKLIDISADDNEEEPRCKQMFWNVMKSFTVEERMLFIRFSSGNLSLPAPGLRWAKNIEINVFSKEDKGKDGKNKLYAHTCFSKVDCPYFESEEELTKMLKMGIEYSGLITDSHENFQEITDYL